MVSNEVWLVRHGETEWSRSGAHTGRTDLPLTEEGERHARAIGEYLAGKNFALVLCSPLLRARDTCRLAGFGDAAQMDDNLREWDYGEYEGRSTLDIRKERPGWSLWVEGVPGGESIAQVAARAEGVVRRVSEASGDVLLFAHGHILRVLAARWVGLSPEAGRLLALSTGSISRLGYERATRVINRWNLSPSD